MKILTIVGARPQFIKAAVVSRAMRDLGAPIQEKIIHTGQHYDRQMSDIFFEDLDIPRPDRNLAVGGGCHGANTGKMLEKLEILYLDEHPDAVLVYGDTDTTLAGGLAAAKLGIPVIHVEAGLRSFDRSMPEEINRVMVDHIAELLFSPSGTACDNLANEGLAGDKVRFSGDVMYDATLYYRRRARAPAWAGDLPDGFCLCTIHRAGNVDDPKRLAALFEGIARGGKPVVLPIHPRTRKNIDTHEIRIPDNVRVVDPVGYLEMNWLEKESSLVLTDSGGVQKEAYFHGKHCLVARPNTEWSELVQADAAHLVDTNPDLIAAGFTNYFGRSPDAFDPVYGAGDAGRIIVSDIVKFGEAG